MLLETQIELIKFFTVFIWILNAVIAGLILISVGVIAWLCYTEGRQSKVRNRQPARSPQSDGRNNSTILSNGELF